jgi:hypothetical protein
MKQTGRIAVNAVEAIFVKELGWIFREQTVSDWGIDAHVVVAEEERPTGRLLALQIKSGKSFFRRKGNLRYIGKREHLRYWTWHSLPVAIVLHNPESGETLWERIDPHKVAHRSNGTWTIEIPRTNVLCGEARTNLESGVSEAVSRRLRMAMDGALIREFESKEEIYLRIEHWVNKSLAIRGVRIFFDDIEKGEPDHDFSIFIPTHNIPLFMSELWPWLSYEYVKEPDLSGFEEMVYHDFRVELNYIGKAFLLLERYYAEGAEIEEASQHAVEFELNLEHRGGLFSEDENSASDTDDIGDNDLPF